MTAKWEMVDTRWEMSALIFTSRAFIVYGNVLVESGQRWARAFHVAFERFTSCVQQTFSAKIKSL